MLYVLHRVLQGTGPEGSTAAAVAAYTVAHRGVLIASEVTVGLALLALIPFLAALVPVIWRTGQETSPSPSPSAAESSSPWASCPTPPRPP